MTIAAIIAATLVIASYALIAWPILYLASRMLVAAAVTACIGIACTSVALIITAVTETSSEVPYILGTTYTGLVIHGALMLLTVRAAINAAKDESGAEREDAEQTF